MQVWQTILRSVLHTLKHTSFTNTTALNSKLFALDVFFRPPALQRLLVGYDMVFQSRQLKPREVVLRHPSVKCVVFCLQLMQSMQIVVNTKVSVCSDWTKLYQTYCYPPDAPLRFLFPLLSLRLFNCSCKLHLHAGCFAVGGGCCSSWQVWSGTGGVLSTCTSALR